MFYNCRSHHIKCSKQNKSNKANQGLIFGKFPNRSRLRPKKSICSPFWWSCDEISCTVFPLVLSCWLLAPESHDLFQAEKQMIVSYAEKIHKMRTIFTQDCQPRTILSENNCHFVNLLSLANSCFFLSLRWIMWSKSQKLDDM